MRRVSFRDADFGEIGPRSHGRSADPLRELKIFQFAFSKSVRLAGVESTVYFIEISRRPASDV